MKDGILVPAWKKSDPVFSRFDKYRNIKYFQQHPEHAFQVKGSNAAHGSPSTHQSIIEVYPHAIVVGSPIGEPYMRTRHVFGLFIALCGVLFCFFGSILTWHEMDLSYPEGWVYELIYRFLCCLVILFFLLGARWSARMIWEVPGDWPIMFNKRDRSVSYFKVNLPSFVKFWSPVRNELVTKWWDDAHCRTYKSMVFTGKTLHSEYVLALLWGATEKLDSLDDYVTVGSTGFSNDETCLMLWEHIRQYMEEGGPPLRPGEALRKRQNSNPPLEFPQDIQNSAGGHPVRSWGLSS